MHTHVTDNSEFCNIVIMEFTMNELEFFLDCLVIIPSPAASLQMCMLCWFLVYFNCFCWSLLLSNSYAKIRQKH